MARGILSGIGLGAAFSVGVAGVVSILVPIEPQPAPELGVAEAVAVPQPAPAQATVTVTGEADSAIVQPQVSLRAPSGEDMPKEPMTAAVTPLVVTQLESAVQEAPISPTPVTKPLIETATLAPLPAPLPPVDSTVSDVIVTEPAPLPQPQTGIVGDVITPRPMPAGVAANIGKDTAISPAPQALAPTIPDDTVDAAIVSPISPTPEPQNEGEAIFVVVPPTPAAEDQDETEAVVVTPAPKPRVTSTPGVQVATLDATSRPSIGTPASSLINRTAQVDDASVETTTQLGAAPEDTSPLARYAQPFKNPEGKPLMSIVLMDDGVDLDTAEIGLPALSSFPYPVSFAVDVRLVDAAKRMARYRAEGFDVLAMLDLPKGAQPSDAEVSLSVALNGSPEIVGVLEGIGEGLQGSRAVADQVTGILKASGHGLVTQNKGLNSMPKLAVKEGVHAAHVFRDFDGAGQKIRVIRRFLDQAAFKAGQEGGVIMLGRLRPETIEALLVWGLADRAGSVALAPVSAVLLQRR